MLNPMILKEGLDLKKYINANIDKINCQVESIFVTPAKDGSGFVTVFQFKFPTEEQANFFKDLYKFTKKIE